MADSILDLASEAARLGLSVVPPKEDGSKAPIGEWKCFQTAAADQATIDGWYSKDRTGLGLVCGAVSGGLEMFELEGRAVEAGLEDELWTLACHLDLNELLGRVMAGYMERTPSGGLHLLYRCPAPVTLKLASAEDGNVLIETKGEGGYTVIAPTTGKVHSTGRPWVRELGDLATIQTITAEEQEDLHALARRFDRSVRKVHTEARQIRSRRESQAGDRPGDRFAAVTAWSEILGPHGWVFGQTAHDGRQHLRRPGKAQGVSATISDDGEGVFYCFTSSAPPFEPNHGYSKFAAHALLNHGGDFTAAARSLAAESPAGHDGADQPHLLDGLGIVVMSDVTPERVEWVWPGRIPKGKLTLLEGDPKTGKSTLALDLAARISTGSPMPDGSRLEGPGAVVLLTAEDGLGDTVRPRLDAAGADTSLMVAWESVPVLDNDGVRVSDRPPSIPEDLPALGALIRHLKAVIVVVDVLNAYLGGQVDSHRDQDVRRALMPLAKLAEATGAAVLVLRHLNKSGGSNPMYRGGGSIGIAGAARSMLLAGVDPTDDSGIQRVLAVTSCNVSAPVPALKYRLVPDEERGCARIQWDGESALTSVDLLQAPSTSEDRTKHAEAREWLGEHLADGPVRATEVMKAWRASGGGSDSTLDRARRDLGVKSRRKGFGKDAVYKWALPSHAHHEDMTSMDVGHNDEQGETAADVLIRDSNAAHTLHVHQPQSDDEHGDRIGDCKEPGPPEMWGLLDVPENGPVGTENEEIEACDPSLKNDFIAGLDLDAIVNELDL